MNKYITRPMLLVVFFFAAHVVASFSFNHEHELGLGHAAATDSNGCHHGTIGFHCHR